MAMTPEHKAALKQGRAESRAIKAYLEAIEARRPGRPVTRESLQQRLERIESQILAEADPLSRVALIQSRIEVEDRLTELTATDDFDSLESEFIRHAKSYSERKGISYSAWRELGVPAATLRSAGIAETRRR